MNNLSNLLNLGICPPNDAFEADSVLYRLITKEPFTENFKSFYTIHVEEGRYTPKKDLEEECRFCGLSVFLDLAVCNRIIGTIPKFKTAKIAKSETIINFGHLKHTPSKTNCEHYTWWVFLNCNDIAIHFVIA